MIISKVFYIVLISSGFVVPNPMIPWNPSGLGNVPQSSSNPLPYQTHPDTRDRFYRDPRHPRLGQGQFPTEHSQINEELAQNCYNSLPDDDEEEEEDTSANTSHVEANRPFHRKVKTSESCCKSSKINIDGRYGDYHGAVANSRYPPGADQGANTPANKPKGKHHKTPSN